MNLGTLTALCWPGQAQATLPQEPLTSHLASRGIGGAAAQGAVTTMKDGCSRERAGTREQKMNLLVLESMGFRVGQALGERLPQETLSLREELDILKFLCKDLWVAAFQKQMDSLRTNHQGTYVLQDNSFPLLVRMASGLQYVEEAPKFLAFTCGLLRGTLSTLGIRSLVTASVAALPACRFQVVVQRS